MTMKNRIVIVILVIIIFGAVLGLGARFLSEFLRDKLGLNFLVAVLVIVVVLWLTVLARNKIKSKNELTLRKSQYLELGKILFKDRAPEFEVYYNAYLKADNKNLGPIEVLHEYADKNGLSLIIDWKGEENDREVEFFITSKIGKSISWTNSNIVREENKVDERRDEQFIIRLFKAIDKDLKVIDKKLLFFDLGTDSYIFTVTDTAVFKEIRKIESKDIHGSEKFKT
jgi:hypothetical protein